METLCSSPILNKENIRLSNEQIVTKQVSDSKTPEKRLLKIKKSDIIKSTAHSHMRSKTGITCLQPIGTQENRGSSARKEITQDGVEVSEFGEYSVGINYSKG